MEGPRIYLVTPPLEDAASFAPILDAALAAAPVACVRLRVVRDEEALISRAADALRETCHRHDVALVVTDHFRLVQQLGVDGVHLADPRLSIREARKLLGEDAIIGGFAGTSRHQGMTLAESGADYVSFGPLVETGLGDGQVADKELFDWWSEMITTPVVAEGGITIELAETLAKSTDFIAAESAVWDHPEGPAAAVKALSALLGE